MYSTTFPANCKLSAEKCEKKACILAPRVRWRGETDTVGFIYHEKDKKNRFLESRLALHFTLCAPNLFGRAKDLSNLYSYLLPDSTCSHARISRYRVHLNRVGLISRPVIRAGKDYKPINTGAVYTMATTSQPGPCDEKRLDLLEDYSTIYLMHQRGSHRRLLTNATAYLKTPFLIKHFTVSHKLCTFPAENYASNCTSYTSPLENSSGSILEGDINADAQTPESRCRDALLYLRNINAQTYVVGAFMQPDARAIFAIFQTMCRRFLRSKNPYRRQRIENVTRLYGPLFGAWLRDAFDAFTMMCANGTFRIGNGHPRKRVKKPEDIVAGSVVPKIVRTVRKVLKRQGKELLNASYQFYWYIYGRIGTLRILGVRLSIDCFSSLLVKDSLAYLRSCRILQ
jgi:hypothetical protein